MSDYVTRDNLSLKTGSWLKKVGPFNRAHLKLNVSRAALLVVDMQSYFTDKGSGAYMCGAYAVLPNIKRLIVSFREAKRPVIFTRHAHREDKSDAGIMGWWWSDMIIDGSKESEIDPALKPTSREKVIIKNRYSAFYRTDLEDHLAGLKIEDIVVTGTMTNLCCESTARDAFYRNYRVFFPADGTGTGSEEMHVASLMNLAYGFAVIKITDEIIDELRGGKGH